jgi:hypothetical protein
MDKLKEITSVSFFNQKDTCSYKFRNVDVSSDFKDLILLESQIQCLGVNAYLMYAETALRGEVETPILLLATCRLRAYGIQYLLHW